MTLTKYYYKFEKKNIGCAFGGLRHVFLIWKIFDFPAHSIFLKLKMKGGFS